MLIYEGLFFLGIIFLICDALEEASMFFLLAGILAITSQL